MEQYNELLEYAQTIKNALENITHDDSLAEDERVQTMYATSSVAFAKYKEQILNGNKNGPLITFYMSNIDIDNSVQLGGYSNLILQRSDANYRITAPVIARLKYTVTINCIREEQADLLQGQILLAMPFNRPYWTKLNGQFVTMVADDPQNLSSVDVGENKDKFSRRQLNITIDRAYLEHTYNKMEKLIGKTIEIRLNSEENK